MVILRLETRPRSPSKRPGVTRSDNSQSKARGLQAPCPLSNAQTCAREVGAHPRSTKRHAARYLAETIDVSPFWKMGYTE